MDIFSVIALIGGLAFFLYGMHILSAGLEKMAGGNLEKTLRKFTETKFKGLLLGAGATIALQSSSTLTVILVGLVNSGIITLEQSMGAIMGSNIGTTLTAWILSLSGIKSSDFFVMMLKPENFSPIIAFIGIILVMASKTTRKQDIGEAMLGFAVLMYGMKLMSSSVAPLSADPGFAKLLVSFTNPVLAVLVGAVFTGIIQSSAASVAILQAFSLTGQITYFMAIPIIMGQNIGTCVTAMISSIGVSKNAKRVGIAHITFNILGTIICLIIFYGLNAFFPLSFLNYPIGAMGIAACHSVFNVFTTLVLYPLSAYIVKLSKLIIKDDPNEASILPQGPFIDEVLFKTPSVAINECNHLIFAMAELAEQTLTTAVSSLKSLSSESIKLVKNNEELLDRYEDRLGTYLVKLAQKELSDSDSAQISKMLHTISDFERIGDHSVNITELSEEIRDKKIVFSPEAQKELKTVSDAVCEIINIATKAFVDDDLNLASDVEPLEQVIDTLTATLKNSHIERLRRGACTIELGFVFTDILSNFERVSDHCSNIAVALIEVAENEFDTHEYLNSIRTVDNKVFRERYESYLKKYTIID